MASRSALNRFNAVRHNAIADTQPVLVCTDEAGLFQNPQMLRDRGLGERQLVDDDAARPSLLTGQHPENAHASRMRGGFRECCEFRVRSFAVQWSGDRHRRVCRGLRRATRQRLVVGVHRLSSMDGNLCAVRIPGTTGKGASGTLHIAGSSAKCRAKLTSSVRRIRRAPGLRRVLDGVPRDCRAVACSSDRDR